MATSKANEGKSIANEMISGYDTLNTRINETIVLIEDVSQGSKEEEKGIIQINDTINTLDQATQVNANSATVISGLANEVTKLSENLLEIADKAKFKETKAVINATKELKIEKEVDSSKATPKTFDSSKSQKTIINQQKTTVITSSKNDDDEWESF